jgi:hypothetical protein
VPDIKDFYYPVHSREQTSTKQKSTSGGNMMSKEKPDYSAGQCFGPDPHSMAA